MLKQWPTLDITRSKQYQVQAQVDKVRSHFIQSAEDNIAEHYDLHHLESDPEHLQFVDSLLAENTYFFPVEERAEGVVRSPNPTQWESKAAKVWPASTLLPGGSNPAAHLH